MTIEYGLTSTGFSPKTFDVIRTEMGDALRAAFGLSLDLGDRSIFGQIVAIFAERVALVWQLAEQVYSSQDPDKAAGAALDALCLLTGTFRPTARASIATLTLTGVPTTIVNAGSKASAPSSGTQFASNTNATIALLASWGTFHFYSVGDRVTNGGNAYICTVAGSSAVSGPGPTSATPNALVTDNAVTWRVMGIGTGAVDVVATATATGALVATSGDCTHIDSAVSGWNGVINLVDAIVGSDVATDEALRLLREAELTEVGQSTIGAIRAALLLLPDTVPGAVTVFENITDVTDTNGLPPHSVECLVRGFAQDAAADQSIRDTLLAEVAAGIATYGTTSGNSVDSQGISHTIKFSRPTLVPIYVTITVVRDSTYPSDGDTQVKNAIIAFGAVQSTGKDAVASSIGAQAFKVVGVLDVPPPKIGTSPSPVTSATVSISTRQLAVFDSSRIIVTSTLGTP